MRAALLIATILSIGIAISPADAQPVHHRAARPAAPAAAPAMPASTHAAISSGIGVPVGGSTILRFDEPVGRVFLGDASIADVIPLTDRSLYLLGKKAGSSSLTIMRRGERATPMATYSIQVGIDTIGLKRTLHDIMPGEDIDVRLAGDGAVLSGAVSSSEAAARAMSIAARFAGDKVVNSMTIRQAEQVMLEVRVSEVQRNQLSAMGLSTNVLWQNSGDSAQLLSGIVNPDAFALLSGAGVSGNYTISAVLDALEQRGAVTTLARPTLVALSGQTANFFAGGEFPIPVASTDAGNLRQVTIEFKQFGVAVAFTPTVIGDTINLHVAPEVSALDRNNAIRLFGTEIPALTTRRAQTTVELRDGQSFAIAGLIRRDFTDNIDGIPGASRMPVLGALFRSTRFERQESEVVMIVTAHRAHPTTLDQLTTPTDLFNAPSQFQLFWGGQIEGSAPQHPVNAHAQASNQPGRFDQNVGYIVQ
jgi:pilus assembly protein CpaC